MESPCGGGGGEDESSPILIEDDEEDDQASNPDSLPPVHSVVSESCRLTGKADSVSAGKEDETHAGSYFRELRTGVVDLLDHCGLSSGVTEDIIQELVAMMEQNKMPSYDQLAALLRTKPDTDTETVRHQDRGLTGSNPLGCNYSRHDQGLTGSNPLGCNYSRHDRGLMDPNPSGCNSSPYKTSPDHQILPPSTGLALPIKDEECSLSSSFRCGPMALPLPHSTTPNMALPLLHSTTPNMAQPLPHSTMPNMAQPLPHSTMPNMAQPLPHSTMPNMAQPLPHSTMPNMAQPLPHSTMPNMAQPLPHSTMPNMAQPLPHSTMPNMAQPLPHSTMPNMAQPLPHSTMPNMAQPLPHSTMPNMAQPLPHSTMPNMAQPLPHSTMPNMAQPLPHSTMPNMAQPLPHSTMPNMAQPLPHSTMPNMAQPLPHSTMPNMAQPLPHSTMPNMAQPLPHSTMPNMAQPLPHSTTPKIQSGLSNSDMMALPLPHSSTPKMALPLPHSTTPKIQTQSITSSIQAEDSKTMVQTSSINKVENTFYSPCSDVKEEKYSPPINSTSTLGDNCSSKLIMWSHDDIKHPQTDDKDDLKPLVFNLHQQAQSHSINKLMEDTHPTQLTTQRQLYEDGKGSNPSIPLSQLTTQGPLYEDGKCSNPSIPLSQLTTQGPLYEDGKCSNPAIPLSQLTTQEPLYEDRKYSNPSIPFSQLTTQRPIIDNNEEHSYPAPNILYTLFQAQTTPSTHQHHHQFNNQLTPVIRDDPAPSILYNLLQDQTTPSTHQHHHQFHNQMTPVIRDDHISQIAMKDSVDGQGLLDSNSKTNNISATIKWNQSTEQFFEEVKPKNSSQAKRVRCVETFNAKRMKTSHASCRAIEGNLNNFSVDSKGKESNNKSSPHCLNNTPVDSKENDKKLTNDNHFFIETPGDCVEKDNVDVGNFERKCLRPKRQYYRDKHDDDYYYDDDDSPDDDNIIDDDDAEFTISGDDDENEDKSDGDDDADCPVVNEDGKNDDENHGENDDEKQAQTLPKDKMFECKPCHVIVYSIDNVRKHQMNTSRSKRVSCGETANAKRMKSSHGDPCRATEDKGSVESEPDDNNNNNNNNDFLNDTSVDNGEKHNDATTSGHFCNEIQGNSRGNDDNNTKNCDFLNDTPVDCEENDKKFNRNNHVLIETPGDSEEKDSSTKNSHFLNETPGDSEEKDSSTKNSHFLNETPGDSEEKDSSTKNSHFLNETPGDSVEKDSSTKNSHFLNETPGDSVEKDSSTKNSHFLNETPGDSVERENADVGNVESSGDALEEAKKRLRSKRKYCRDKYDDCYREDANSDDDNIDDDGDANLTVCGDDDENENQDQSDGGKQVQRPRGTTVECQVCNGTFDSTGDLNRHQKMKTLCSQHLSPLLQYRVTKDLNVGVGGNVSYRYTCEICGKLVKQSDGFMMHVIHKHGKGTRRTDTDSSVEQDGRINHIVSNLVQTVLAKNTSIKIERDLSTCRVETLSQSGSSSSPAVYYYQCPLCPSQLNRRYLLKKHIIFNHGVHGREEEKTDLQILNIVQTIFADHRGRNDEEKYIRTIHDRHRFECNVCHKTLTRADALKHHIRTIHDGQRRRRTFECSLCHKIVASASRLRQHIRTIHDGHRFECSVCHKTLSRADALKHHIRTIHDGQRKRDAPEDPLSKYCLTPEIKLFDKKTYKCTICDKTLQKRERFIKHVIKIHRECTSKKKNSEEKKNDIFLNLVKQVLTANSYRNIEDFSSCRLEVPPKHNKRSGPVVKFQCPLCPVSLTRKDLLPWHIIFVHGFSDTDTSALQIMNTVDSILSDGLKKKQHEERMKSRSFQCSLCHKIMSTSNGFKSHILRQHSDLIRFQCKHCNMSFSSHDEIKDHVMQHVKMDSSSKLDLNLSDGFKEKQVAVCQSSTDMKVASKSIDTKVANKSIDTKVANKSIDTKVANKSIDTKVANKSIDTKVANKSIDTKVANKSIDTKVANKSIDTKVANKSIDTKVANKSIDTKVANKSIDTKVANKSIDTKVANKSIDTKVSNKSIDSKASVDNSSIEATSSNAHQSTLSNNSSTISKQCPMCSVVCSSIHEVCQHTTDQHQDVFDTFDGTMKYGWRMEFNGEIFNCQLNTYICLVCHETFFSFKDLDLHEKTHGLGNGYYKCMICGKELNTHADLWNHIRNHDGTREFPCDGCDHSVYFKLSPHGQKMFAHTKISCSSCPKTFISKTLYLNHFKVYHRQHIIYQCPECDKQFRARCRMKRHRLIVHNIGELKLCSYCGKGFHNNYSLKIHTRVHTGEKAYKCSVCGKEFIRHRTFYMHRRSHTEIKTEYLCSVCGKSFTSSPAYHMHIRIHSGFKKYKCEVCGFRFIQPCSLKRHMKTHAKES